jgi:adenine/guanine/hypoxanthine permease
MEKLGQVGVLYEGLAILGGGATLAGIILGAVTVFIIDRQFEKAAAFAAAGGVLTFFGLIHSEAIGLFQTPVVALSYIAIAALLFGCAKYAKAESAFNPHATPVAAE